MYFDYFSVLVFSAVGLVFVFANMIVASVVRPKRQTDKGLETYECGEETIGDAWIRFDIRYYTVALVYVIFAVEIAFLFPWALVMKSAVNGTGAAVGADVGPLVLVKGFLFISILFLGLAYVWAKGDLNWVLSYSKTPYQPPAERQRLNQQSVKELEEALDPKPEDSPEDGDKPDDEEAA
ncbi:MAG: NADH-quinone oxidoreductase subunit A [Planctomycetota bacterium]|jgi:NADH-quinone oxidoreductase subunit A